VIEISAGLTDTAGAFFQWLKDGVYINDDEVVYGSSTPVLTLNNPTTNYEGNYSLLIQGLCGGGLTTVPVMVRVKLKLGVSYPVALQSQCSRTPLTPITPVVMPGSTISGKVSTYSGVLGSGNVDGDIIDDAKYTDLGDIKLDKAGNIYLLDGNAIRKIDKNTHQVMTIAGNVETSGNINGNGLEARFNNPTKMVIDTSGNLFVIDLGNNCIRKVTPQGVVTTFVGGTNTTNTRVDGVGTDARFKYIGHMAIDKHNNIYVVDVSSSYIYYVNFDGTNSGHDPNNLDVVRKITPEGVVTTIKPIWAGQGTSKISCTYMGGIETDLDGNIILVLPFSSLCLIFILLV
jgi:hypothetical protein